MHRFVCLLAFTACVPSGRLPVVTTPQGNAPFGKGMVAGVGVELPAFGASYRADGTEHRDVTYGPRRKIPLLQLFSFGLRRSIATRCDVGGQLGIGITGADVRCGLGDEDRTVAIATGASFRWWHGLVGHTELQAGIHRNGYLAFVSTGVAYGYFWHAIGLADDPPIEDVLIGPSEPYLRIRQIEIAWSSSITLGLPPIRDSQPTIFLSVGVDQPIATAGTEFSCHGCAGTFSDFDPGVRLRGVIGIAATMR